MFLHHTIGGPVFRRRLFQHLEALCSKLQTIEGPVFRLYRRTPFSRERSVRFRRESADWSSASSRSTTPSGAEKAQVSLSRVCSCNSIPRFLAHSVNPPPLSVLYHSKSQILKHSHLHSCARLIPRPPHRPRTSAQLCGGNKGQESREGWRPPSQVSMQ